MKEAERRNGKNLSKMTWQKCDLERGGEARREKTGGRIQPKFSIRRERQRNKQVEREHQSRKRSAGTRRQVIKGCAVGGKTVRNSSGRNQEHQPVQKQRGTSTRGLTTHRRKQDSDQSMDQEPGQ
jgi:hypothetical protein